MVTITALAVVPSWQVDTSGPAVTLHEPVGALVYVCLKRVCTVARERAQTHTHAYTRQEKNSTANVRVIFSARIASLGIVGHCFMQPQNL